MNDSKLKPSARQCQSCDRVVSEKEYQRYGTVQAGYAARCKCGYEGSATWIKLYPQDTESNSAEWVAVSERLPESDREVLVFVHNPYQPKFKSWVIANCRYDGTFWHGKGHTNVTHWQYQYNPAEDK